jgi:putative protease
LLAPARDKHCGIEALRHGADAVYVGALRWSARAAAANSLEDIAELTAFAHRYHARIYVALNTLLTDEELPEAIAMAQQLDRIGIDALIVQDPRLVNELRGAQCAVRMPLHASTQMDNRTVEQVQARADAGFRQIVLARELTLDEIRAIHAAVPAPRLEAFVHGALCMSYSGRCYISEHLYNRSANRGVCAQVCRLNFDLCTADGQVLAKGQPLLSLKDLNRSQRLADLLSAGIRSFKIEGRLKDAAYVKNITAYYRQQLDDLIRRHPDLYHRASSGHTRFTFTPDPHKSFNRGFTEALPYTAERPLTALPTHLGEPMDARTPFHNGDGALLVYADGTTHGFRVNRADGALLHTREGQVIDTRRLPAGAHLYRNHDTEFEALLARTDTADRRIHLSICLRELSFGFALDLTDEDGVSVSLAFPDPKEAAKSPQEEHIRTALTKLGDTIFVSTKYEVRITGLCFLPAGRLNEWRRRGVESLLRARVLNHRRDAMPVGVGRVEVSPAPSSLIHSRYCIRRELGICLKQPQTDTQPLYLQRGTLHFPLKFDCKACEMYVLAP